MASSRWHQDKEVAELIEYFDQPERYEQWQKLTQPEMAIVLKELDRCRRDFVYAARNYFWISNKALGNQLFSLWPSQELILQKIMEMKAKGLAQKIIIIKARQLGCSTLIEALIAWRTMFFCNVNAIVVSYDIDHAAHTLYPIMQFIYDRMPWWLQPMTASRRAEEGLWFDNPKADLRRVTPGLNSRVHVKGATAGGVGQGIRLSAAHISEFADFDDHIASNIIDEDMTNALVEGPGTFAILESTAKGANRFAHRLWRKCMDLEDKAEWFPLFLPFFFDPTHVRPIVTTVDGGANFRPDKTDLRMRDRVINEWVRCNNPLCKQFHNRWAHHIDRAGTRCLTCDAGTVQPYWITDDQLHWIQHRRDNANRDEKSMKKLLQEQASSAEEAFQVTGYQVFGQKAQDFANSCVREPIAVGDFDLSGRLHGCDPHGQVLAGNHGDYRHCFQEDCTLDHSYDDNPLQIWEFPLKNGQYCIGGDVAEGLGGKADYSTGVGIRYTELGDANYQVATWRSNTIDPIGFAAKLYWLGTWYNDALMAVECNKYDTCLGQLRFVLAYPNMYRWKHVDSVNPISNKLGWFTDVKSRPRLYQTFRAWLNQEVFQIRSRIVAEQMKSFIKDDYDDAYAGADRDEHDDDLMSCMIALFCAVEGSYNEALGLAIPRTDLTLDNATFIIECLSCHLQWPEKNIHLPQSAGDLDNPKLDEHRTVERAGGQRCPRCLSRQVQITRNSDKQKVSLTDADAAFYEARSWSPDMEFNNTPLPYELL